MRDDESADALRCSFCSKSQADVRKLIAGEHGQSFRLTHQTRRLRKTFLTSHRSCYEWKAL